MWFGITLGAFVVFSLVCLAIILWVIKLAKKDINFTELPPHTGKIIVMGKKVTNILFNSDTEHYAIDGTLTPGSKSLGWLFEQTGRIFYGIYPIWKIFKFDVTWGEYVREGDEHSVIKREECGCTRFKRYYTHAIKVGGSEMHKESPEGTSDTSTTRIDAFFLITIEVINVIDSIFKMPPEGVAFEQLNASVEGAFNDYARQQTYENFREENKLKQNEAFIKDMRDEANEVLGGLGIGMRIHVMELKYFDLTPSEENKKLLESQTEFLINQNKAAAAIELATGEKEAIRLRLEGQADGLAAVKKVIGAKNIGTFADLEQVKETGLLVFGASDTKTVLPLVKSDKGDKS